MVHSKTCVYNLKVLEILLLLASLDCCSHLFLARSSFKQSVCWKGFYIEPLQCSAILLSESINSFINSLNGLFLSFPFLAQREVEKPFEVIKLVFWLIFELVTITF